MDLDLDVDERSYNNVEDVSRNSAQFIEVNDDSDKDSQEGEDDDDDTTNDEEVYHDAKKKITQPKVSKSNRPQIPYRSINTLPGASLVSSLMHIIQYKRGHLDMRRDLWDEIRYINSVSRQNFLTLKNLEQHLFHLMNLRSIVQICSTSTYNL
jgi:hypothetical protein